MTRVCVLIQDKADALHSRMEAFVGTRTEQDRREAENRPEHVDRGRGRVCEGMWGRGEEETKTWTEDRRILDIKPVIGHFERQGWRLGCVLLPPRYPVIPRGVLQGCPKVDGS